MSVKTEFLLLFIFLLSKKVTRTKYKIRIKKVSSRNEKKVMKSKVKVTGECTRALRDTRRTEKFCRLQWNFFRRFN